MHDLLPQSEWNDHADQAPDLGILVRASGDEVVISVAGELDLVTAPAVLRQVQALACLPVEALTIDLAAVEFLDSSGLNMLNQVRLLAAERRLPFTLASVPPCAQRVLEVTEMDGLFSYR